MSPGEDVVVQAGRLAADGKPYVLATVVRVVRPASTRRGDRALVTPDGRLAGWVGGACSEPTVIREALRALADGEPRLVHICRPDGVEEAPPDVVVAESTCASEGTVEVLIEPHVPKPLVAVVGEAPAARALAALARIIGWRVSEIPAPDPRTGTGLGNDADAVVVATMGREDEEALVAALATPAGYIGLVASARRAAAVINGLRSRGLAEEALVRVRSPAGLDLGPSSQEEIAVAILAELVAWHNSRQGAATHLLEAIDPVCGMTVALAGARETAVHDGVTYTFCCSGCLASFEADPTRYLAGGEASLAP